MPLTPGIHHWTPSLALHVLQADEPGPTVLVQACIHGDEIAGAHALYEMLEDGLAPTRGKLIVVPVMNPPAYRARERTAPGGLDLNRCFPGNADAWELEQRLARRFMDMVLDEQPVLVATLHESSSRFDPSVVPSFGQTLVYGVKPMPPVIGRVVEQLNVEFSTDNEHWAPLYYPVSTSSTEVIVDAVGCVGICVETWKGFQEAHRVAMQKAVVRRLLEDFGLL
jgi:hypothetical protein